jgi:ADP-heptose:LPS heptosyltransferase
MAKNVLPRVGWDKLYVREVDYYMEGVRRLGYAGITPPLYCPVTETLSPPFVRASDIQYVGLCNGSFGSMGPMKQWPYFKELARVLRAYYGSEVSIVKLGHKKELENVEADHDFVGKLDICETAHVISKLSLFITVDTGLMHIADALKVPMIVLWGATLVSKNGPVNGTAKILRAKIPCQPCQYTKLFEKCTKLDCLRLLSVGETMVHVRAQL